MSIKEVKTTLELLKVTPKRSLGQNFLVDANIVKKVVTLADITESDVVLEVGPGLGALTEGLARESKKVVAVEIDEVLSSYLRSKFSETNNVEILTGDILKIKLPHYNKVVSNVPYTMTGPILERVCYSSQPPTCVMIIEKALTQRIFNKGRYKDFSRISVSSNAFLNPVVQQPISRKSFFPVPKIDLSLIKCVPKTDIAPFLDEPSNIALFLRFVSQIMPYKNKSVLNGLKLCAKAFQLILLRDQLLMVLRKAGITDPGKKIFQLTVDQILSLSIGFQPLLEKNGGEGH